MLILALDKRLRGITYHMRLPHSAGRYVNSMGFYSIFNNLWYENNINTKGNQLRLILLNKYSGRFEQMPQNFIYAPGSCFFFSSPMQKFLRRLKGSRKPGHSHFQLGTEGVQKKKVHVQIPQEGILWHRIPFPKNCLNLSSKNKQDCSLFPPLEDNCPFCAVIQYQASKETMAPPWVCGRQPWREVQ